jgi:hypothetical protein
VSNPQPPTDWPTSAEIRRRMTEHAYDLEAAGDAADQIGRPDLARDLTILADLTYIDAGGWQ